MFYYATLPSSLSLACSLDDTLKNVDVLQVMSKGQTSSHSQGSLSQTVDRRASLLLKTFAESLSTFESVPLDLDAIQARGWTNGENAGTVSGLAAAVEQL